MHTPRGSQASLNHGGLPEVISPYMRALIDKTGGVDGPIGKQFIAQPEVEAVAFGSASPDPQHEAAYEVAPGLIYKYRGAKDVNGTVKHHGRVLWTISRFCATYCRFCFRGRMVGVPATQVANTQETLGKKAYLSNEDIEQVKNFLIKNTEINEVILSGGDPLITPSFYFNKIILLLKELQELHSIDFVRIHTRAPITNPESLSSEIVKQLAQLRLPHVVLHINHPDELTEEVKEKVRLLRQEAGAVLFSQTVLLKGVNDSEETLRRLFTDCAKIGIRPYYLHYTDPVPWVSRFVVPFAEAVALWQRLRPTLSGIIATVKFVIDTPGGVGKVVIPESAWENNLQTFTDFVGTTHERPL